MRPWKISFYLLLNHFLLRRKNWILQQDGATAHTGNSVKEWFQRQHITLLPWSAQSSNLNPIENIWSWVNKKLSRENVGSVAQLKLELEKIWSKILKELCTDLIVSMPKPYSSLRKSTR